jgi:hypothetical protein
MQGIQQRRTFKMESAISEAGYATNYPGGDTAFVANAIGGCILVYSRLPRSGHLKNRA